MSSEDPHAWVERSAMRLATGTVDFARSRFVRDDGVVERLTTREAETLAFLIDHADEPVARDDLLGAVWGHHEQSLSRAVDAAISRLRKKIDDGDDPRVLFTVHGHGYRLLVDPATPAVAPASVSPGPRRVLTLGTREVDLGTGFVEDGAARSLLAARERVILEVLLQARGGVVDAHKLARLAGIIGGKSALSSAVARLRAKIEVDPATPRFLFAVRGEGYRLEAPPPEEPTLYPEAHALALRSLARHVGLVLGADDCVVYRWEDGRLCQVAAFGHKARTDGGVLAPLRQAPGEGIVGHAALARRPLRVDACERDPRYLRDTRPARSEVAVPILVDGAVVGAIDSESTSPAAFDEGFTTALVLLAAVAAPGFLKVRST